MILTCENQKNDQIFVYGILIIPNNKIYVLLLANKKVVGEQLLIISSTLFLMLSKTFIAYEYTIG